SVLNLLAMANIKSVLVGTLVVAGVATPIIIQHRANVRLQTELDALRTQTAPVLSTQQTVGPADLAELERLRHENAELVRLRGEVAALRQRVGSLQHENEDPAARIKAMKLASEESEAKILLAKSPEVPMVSARQWNNLGFATPASAFETLN